MIPEGNCCIISILSMRECMIWKMHYEDRAKQFTDEYGFGKLYKAAFDSDDEAASAMDKQERRNRYVEENERFLQLVRLFGGLDYFLGLFDVQANVGLGPDTFIRVFLKMQG